MNPRFSAIRSALDFLEGHLQEEITVGDIADAAGYSLYHFIRTFNQVVQHSPYDFLMRRRLTEAARELLVTDRRILDIALDYCFHSHETFSRAFKRMFDIQPSQWPDQYAEKKGIILPALSKVYLAHINHQDFLFPEIITTESGRQVRFFHLGPDRNLPLTLSYIHHTWLPQAEVCLVYPPSAEHFLHNENLVGRSASIPVI